MTTIKRPEPILFLSDARGVFIPRDFANEIVRDCVTGISDPAVWDILRRGPDHDLYWDAWSEMMDQAVITVPSTGIRYRIHQDGDCWLLPEDMVVTDSGEFAWPPEHGLDCRCIDCRDARGDWEYHDRQDRNAP